MENKKKGRNEGWSEGRKEDIQKGREEKKGGRGKEEEGGVVTSIEHVFLERVARDHYVSYAPLDASSSASPRPSRVYTACLTELTSSVFNLASL